MKSHNIRRYFEQQEKVIAELNKMFKNAYDLKIKAEREGLIKPKPKAGMNWGQP